MKSILNNLIAISLYWLHCVERKIDDCFKKQQPVSDQTYVTYKHLTLDDVTKKQQAVLDALDLSRAFEEMHYNELHVFLEIDSEGRCTSSDRYLLIDDDGSIIHEKQSNDYIKSFSVSIDLETAQKLCKEA